MFNVTWRSVHATIFEAESQKMLPILCVCVCVFVVFGVQHEMRIRHIVIYGLPGCTIFFYISKTAQFSKKKRLLNFKCAF